MVDWSFLSGKSLGIMVFVVSVLVSVGCIIGAYMLLRRWLKYKQFKCIIWERDGLGNVSETIDGAGIFTDWKTNSKRFFMRNAKVGLNPDNIPFIKIKTGFLGFLDANKKVYLLKTGLKNFSFITPQISNPTINMSVGEEDLNWASYAYEKQKKLFKMSDLLPYLSLALIAFVSVMILVMFIYFFREFSVLASVASSLKEAAQAMAQAQSGTVVVQ